VDSFYITAQFKEEDSSYDWMMVWLSKQPSWSMFLPLPTKHELTAYVTPLQKKHVKLKSPPPISA